MKIKSPFRFFIFLLILCAAAYGIFAAFNTFTGGRIHFGFWGTGSSYEKSVQNFIVAGVDDDGTRTDIILLCQYNMAENNMVLLQIPRDTKVETERADKKINSAYGSKDKEKTLTAEVEKLTGIKAEKYAIITFKGFRDIIDAIGGVEVDVPMRMYYTDPYQNLTIDLNKGRQTLSGKQAEMFMRFRSGYSDGDVGRIKAQREFYKSVANKLLSGNTLLKAPKLLGIVQKSLKTNFTGEEMLSYAGKAMKLGIDGIKILQVPGEGKYIGKVSYFVADNEQLKQMITENFVKGEGSGSKSNSASFKNHFIKVGLVDATGLTAEQADVLKMVQERLEDYGFNVVEAVKSDKKQEQSRVVEHNAKAAGAEILKVYENLPVSGDDDKDAKTDVTIFIGTDFVF